jgi:Ni,Fe-hydrogenase I cytochrome b subunit
MNLFGVAFGSILGMVILILVGFYIGKSFPSLFSAIPGVNKVL